MFLAVLMLSGCALRHSVGESSLPDQFHVEIGDLRIRSDIEIAEDTPILLELKALREEIAATLALPPAHRPVTVHLFGNHERYQEYMQKTHPNLPARRAFFIGTPTELAVYAHWSANVEEDLRHEYTHGILHASLRTVPLWLDEGLAEYFETRTQNAAKIHPEHTPRLALALSNGWRPDLRRLEKIQDVSEMHRADYQEAWAWVHYLLHEVPDGRPLLIEYCQSLRYSSKPPVFSDRIEELLTDPETRLASYIALSLNR